MKKGEVSPVLRSPGRLPHRQAHRRAQPQRADRRRADARAPHPGQGQRDSRPTSRRRRKIDRIRERIDTGAKFDDQARVNSEDASSAQGRRPRLDQSPGDTVPEFERRWTKLKINELSQPVRSPFGWHLIQVAGAAQAGRLEGPPARPGARRRCAQRKADEQFAEFVRQMRDRAYVEIKVDER